MKDFIERNETPKNLGFGNGWCAALDRAWSNGRYAVMSRELSTNLGRITHAFIRNAAGRDISWKDKQEIKNKIFGKEALAIEVFPPESQLVDEVNAYHLWILHDLHDWPFNLKRSSK